MRLIFSIVLMVPLVASAELYKCTGPDGKVNFTDRPCGPSEASKALQVDEVSKARQAEEKKRKDLRAWTNNYQRERADKYKQRSYSAGLRVGMSQDEVTSHPVWGYPDDSNTTSTQYGVREQWIYETDLENEYERTYIYFENGVLTAIQD